MRIKIGEGNAVSAAFNPTAKTLTFTGAYNFSIDPSSLNVWDNTISGWVCGGTSTTAASAAPITFTGGLPVQVIQLAAAPSGAASGDTLVITCECPDAVALYNASIEL